jgi:ribA/ribD-fused uncharacterized protein
MAPPDDSHLADLIRRTDGGERLKLLHFWGHTERTPGAIDKSCFSQWYPAPFASNGNTYATAEHYMMFHKAELFGDKGTAAKILEDARPAVAKKLGREVRDFDETRWSAKRFDLVVQGSILKFTQNPKLGEFLTNTGQLVLVEASPTDRVWGIGLAADDERASDPRQWRGLNLLGFALMQARERLGLADVHASLKAKPD